MYIISDLGNDKYTCDTYFGGMYKLIIINNFFY